MTSEEAKAALGLCPPEDDTNPDIPRLGEALELAATNAELGIWWGKEKNFDLYFSRKLALIASPGELAPTILRGGAMIFYASRLIAESAGEVPEELPTLPDVPETAARSPISALGPFPASPKAAPAPARDSKWLWLRALVLVVGGGLILLAGLFVLEYVLATNNPAGPATASTAGQLAKLETIAGKLDSAPASPPPTAQTLDDMRKYLDDQHSPDPAQLPALVAQPAPQAIVTVQAENWNAFAVTHFTIQTDAGLSHLIVLEAKDFSSDDIPTSEISRKLGPFQEKIWSEDGYIYLELTPSS